MHASTFQILGDPNRLRLVEALREGERSVGELEAVLDIHQSGVSRHLKVLADAGFVKSRADGQRRLYSLRAEPFRAIEQWVAQYRAHWDKRLDRFALALERSRGARSVRKEKA